ncbi:TPA: hypothetical protein N2696_004029 [Vibrio parahaemolyticus]|uniref:hypothetical protein n=1 Tax=Vibrio TaxID=662 RepID=UPI000543B1A3|nr:MULTISPECIES: hypothetical protein [Vibrio]AVF60095.1 hypothetical protein AL537_12440 [Vibrio diabolicus]AVF63968.1 hypothetical protein AL541_06405 [Vibrio alginolyticus]EGR2358290.1 hypothetical protein [Vibrio parahaemolyticus]EGR3425094.1 hypothetical protein [Vibrio parahaemolyticus]EJC6797418.1 hypothetical protein [Vibrio parahaemolyticus]
MGQVRENLPNGDPRNKIEYLADMLDRLEKQLPSEPIEPVKAIFLDAKTIDLSRMPILNVTPDPKVFVKKLTFDFYSEERFLPHNYIVPPTSNFPSERRMYCAGYGLSFFNRHHVDDTSPLKTSEYINDMTKSVGVMSVDGNSVNSLNTAGWLFDGNKHHIEVVYTPGELVSNIGGLAFTGCVWNLKGYDADDNLIFHLPLTGGEGEIAQGTSFYDLIRGEHFETQVPLKWVELPSHVKA